MFLLLYFMLMQKNLIWHGFLTSEQIQGLTKNKISVSKKLTKKNFKIYFEKTINQIILF